MASNMKKDSMRLVCITLGIIVHKVTEPLPSNQIHLPSLTAFSNWPTSSTPLGHVTSVDFSPRSEYIAVGNSRGRVLLYHLRDFSML